MRLLLDTHVLLGLFDDGYGRGSEIGRLVKNREHELLVSVASLWEIAIKSRLGKLRLTVPLEDLPRETISFGCTILPVSADQAIAEVSPWPSTNDPFDRLLLQVCTVLGLRLVTSDALLRDHPLAWRPA